MVSLASPLNNRQVPRELLEQVIKEVVKERLTKMLRTSKSGEDSYVQMKKSNIIRSNMAEILSESPSVIPQNFQEATQPLTDFIKETNWVDLAIDLGKVAAPNVTDDIVSRITTINMLYPVYVSDMMDAIFDPENL